MSRGREDRSQRRRLVRKVKKLLRQAPERQPGESIEEYARRLRSWILNRVNEATDSGDLWSVPLSSIIEHDAETVSTGSEPWIARSAEKDIEATQGPGVGSAPGRVGVGNRFRVMQSQECSAKRKLKGG